MIDAMFIGLLLGTIFALFDHVGQWTKRARRSMGELARALVVGAFAFGPPVILAMHISQTVNWLLAVTVTWTVLALSRPDLRDWARGA